MLQAKTTKKFAMENYSISDQIDLIQAQILDIESRAESDGVVPKDIEALIYLYSEIDRYDSLENAEIENDFNISFPQSEPKKCFVIHALQQLRINASRKF